MTSATYADVLEGTRELVARLSRPPVVGIGGHGGAGKTTLSVRLAADLGVQPEQVVSTDRLYAATDTRRAGLFELQDWPVVFDLLERVRRVPTPERLAYPTRFYEGEEGAVDVPMPAAVILEGIRVIRPETLPLLDLAVWIDLDPVVAGERAKARNLLQGDSRAELDLWDTKWVPEGHEYQRLVQPERLAHLVLRPSVAAGSHG